MGNNLSFAFFTLASGDSYVNGAIGLAYSLQRVQSKYPLIVGVSNCSNTALLQLKRLNIKYIVYPDNEVFNSTIYRYNTTIQKFHLLELTEYDKIIFLDADAIVLQNIDYLFYKYQDNAFVFEDKSIHGAYFLITLKNFFSYSFIKDKFINTAVHDEDVLEALGKDYPNLIYQNLLFQPNEILCVTQSLSSQEYVQNVDGTNAKVFHDNSNQNKKLFLHFNYFDIINYLQDNKNIPSIIIEDIKKYQNT